MIQIRHDGTTSDFGPERARELDGVLAFCLDKMAGSRSDAHDTATLGYVVLERIRRAIKDKRTSTWVSNEGVRAAHRELLLYQDYRERHAGGVEPFATLFQREFASHISRQDGAQQAEEQAKRMRHRPTVREARNSLYGKRGAK